jgi:hypothetical protein
MKPPSLKRLHWDENTWGNYSNKQNKKWWFIMATPPPLSKGMAWYEEKKATNAPWISVL